MRYEAGGLSLGEVQLVERDKDGISDGQTTNHIATDKWCDIEINNHPPAPKHPIFLSSTTVFADR